MTTAGRPFIRLTARWRSSSDSTRGWRISTNSWSGNCASSAVTRRAAVSPVASETTWSSTGGVAAIARRLARRNRMDAGVCQPDEVAGGELDLERLEDARRIDAELLRGLEPVRVGGRILLVRVERE